MACPHPSFHSRLATDHNNWIEGWVPLTLHKCPLPFTLIPSISLPIWRNRSVFLPLSKNGSAGSPSSLHPLSSASTHLPSGSLYPTEVMIFLFGCLSSWHTGHLRRGNNNWENDSIRLAQIIQETSSWGILLISDEWDLTHCGRFHPWAGCPGDSL